jgi:hypothetical protein
MSYIHEVTKAVRKNTLSMLVALTEVYHNPSIIQKFYKLSTQKSVTCCKCMFQHFQQTHHNGWSHKSKATDHGTAAWSVSKGMMELPQDISINRGPNTINAMPTNYIIWKTIQLSLSYHPFAETEPCNSTKVLEYFNQGAALGEFYKYWHNCSQISYMSYNMTCKLSSWASFKPVLP